MVQTVKTKDELYEVQKNKTDLIIIEGEYADLLKKQKTFSQVLGMCIGVIIMFFGFTLNSSSIIREYYLPVIIVASIILLCISFMMRPFNKYKELEYTQGKLILELKQKK